MSRRTLNLNNELYRYLLAKSVREPGILTRLREETGKMPGGRMQIAPEQGQFMGLLIKLTGAVKALEIGVFTGYSALSVALALPEDGRLVAFDNDPEPLTIASRYFKEAGVEDKIQLHNVDATEGLTSLISDGQAESFDFAFIDADKENYERYFDAALTLVKTGGLIAVDNVLWSGRVADPDNTDPATLALRTFNEKRLFDRRIDISLVPIGDGLTLARKR